MAVYVGCDLGTMGSKAAVVDGEGRLLGEAFEEVPLQRPRAGWVQQDPDRIEASAHRVISRAVEASGRGDDVAALAISGQMSGIGTVDEQMRPATHYDSWLDTRCEPWIRHMAADADRVVEVAGCPPTYSHGPKMLWWQHERPDDYARIARFLPIASYVTARAVDVGVGDAFIDDTYLHFSNVADTRAGTWSEELVDHFGLDPARLPRIVRPTDVVGELCPEVAETTGLPVGTPVAAGAGDTAAAALGAGAVVPGRAFDAAGTASVLALCVDGFHPDVRRHTLMCSRGVVPGTFVSLAFINGGGLALRWFRDEVATDLREQEDAYQRLDALAAEVEPGSEGLLWFPHLQGRVLPPVPQARGAWIGLTSRHGHGHLFRALLEGVALEYAEWMRLATDAADVPLTEARVLGGGAASDLWNQIKADVLGIDWVPTRTQEAGVLGDALIAAAAVGDVTDLAGAADRWQATGSPVRPDPERHHRYQSLRPAYRAMAEALTPVFDRLGEASDG